jgi:protein-disulfide isomerase
MIKRPHLPFEIEAHRRSPRKWRLRRSLIWSLVALLLFGVAAWLVLRTQAGQSLRPVTSMAKEQPAGPPWIYGRPDARVTVIEYADLECPFCRSYFPVLKRWIDEHPEVNWQWHHLPLAMHEPAASRGARLVECVGEGGGQAAFWQAVEWVYAHTRGDGQGLPEGLAYPGLTPAVQQCLASDRADALIRAQAAEAAKNGILATPTLRLRDRETGKTLLLPGPVEGDALLSAVDLLASGGQEAAEPSPSSRSPDMPAATAGNTAR